MHKSEDQAPDLRGEGVTPNPWGIHILVLGLLVITPICTAAPLLGSKVLDLATGWRIAQDVHDVGEKYRWFEPTKDNLGDALVSADYQEHPLAVKFQMNRWQEIPRLTHLQLLLARQPYFGRELRYFNEHSWWYRLDFPTPPDLPGATLRFEGVDYYAKVWLNGILLGEHEGYADPFEFEVARHLKTNENNTLVVEVSSPWDQNEEPWGFFSVKRNMLKGTYEHADGLIQRDVNPVGIFKPVKLLLHDGVRAETPWVRSKLSPDAQSATVSTTWPLQNDVASQAAEVAVKIVSLTDGGVVAQSSRSLTLAAGANSLDELLTVKNPSLWSTWDRGSPALYRAEFVLSRPGKEPVLQSVDFGFRTVELRRSQEEAKYFLNGKALFLRGTSYFPDVYLSNVDRARYERDVAAAIRAGINALRVHVHIQNPEFYEVCDRAGMLVIQDFDLNWNFPKGNQSFEDRALKLFSGMIRKLRNHPSIGVWIPMNEVFPQNPQDIDRIGPKLVAEAKRLDPTRPTIKNSGVRDDLESGDTHDYRGSLAGEHYTNIFGSTARLNTEFGVDAPPSPLHAQLIPEIAGNLTEVLPRVSELHDYQYRLTKYYIEHHRIQKYAPNGGYFQFMWIDLCPQSFYGIYDYWGAPKVEGLGGGLRAFMESGQPVGVFMEYKDTPIALHAVNDTLEDFGEVTAHWRITRGNHELVTEGSRIIHLAPDSRVRISDLSFPVTSVQVYRITLQLVSKDGRVLADNVYEDPFNHPPRPKGYPERMNHELGMRLWWQGIDN
jgi:beta-mannosidase